MVASELAAPLDSAPGYLKVEAVYAAAQAAIGGADCALAEGCAYALCRPPGHHAYADSAGGFCFLNNSAIAAARMLAATGGPVAILDARAAFEPDVAALACAGFAASGALLATGGARWRLTGRLLLAASFCWPIAWLVAWNRGAGPMIGLGVVPGQPVVVDVVRTVFG